MIIHLTGGTRHVGEDLPYLRKIKSTIVANGSSIARDWIDNALMSSSHKDNDSFDWHDVYEKSMEALGRSDLMIIEVTTYSFFQGFHLARAIDLRKPTLVVFRNEVSGRIFEGIDSEFVTCESYGDEKQLEQLVTQFLVSHSTNNSSVQIKLSVKLNEYLKTRTSFSHKTDDEILCDLAEDGLKYRQLMAASDKI